jgi:hypothetical protein
MKVPIWVLLLIDSCDPFVSSSLLSKSSNFTSSPSCNRSCSPFPCLPSLPSSLFYNFSVSFFSLFFLPLSDSHLLLADGILYCFSLLCLFFTLTFKSFYFVELFSLFSTLRHIDFFRHLSVWESAMIIIFCKKVHLTAVRSQLCVSCWGFGGTTLRIPVMCSNPKLSELLLCWSLLYILRIILLLLACDLFFWFKGY